MENHIFLKNNNIQHRRLDLLLSQSSSSIVMDPDLSSNLLSPISLPYAIQNEKAVITTLGKECNIFDSNLDMNSNFHLPLSCSSMHNNENESNIINKNFHPRTNINQYFGETLILQSFVEPKNKRHENSSSSNFFTNCKPAKLSNRESSENYVLKKETVATVSDSKSTIALINSEITKSFRNTDVLSSVLSEKSEKSSEMNQNDQIEYCLETICRKNNTQQVADEIETFFDYNLHESNFENIFTFYESRNSRNILEDQEDGLLLKELNFHSKIKAECVPNGAEETHVLKSITSEYALKNYEEVCMPIL